MNKIIKTRCGLPHNKFNFFIDDAIAEDEEFKRIEKQHK